MADTTESPYRVGVDIGSTTLKVAVMDGAGTLIFSAYQRHQADIKGTAADIATRLLAHPAYTQLLCVVLPGGTRS